MSEVQNNLPSEVSDKVTSNITNTMLPGFEQSLHPLYDVGERLEQAYISFGTTLSQTTELLQRIKDTTSHNLQQPLAHSVGNSIPPLQYSTEGMNAQFQDMQPARPQQPDLNLAFNKSLVGWKATGLAIESAITLQRQAQHDVSFSKSPLAYQNKWLEASRHLGQLFVP